MSRRGGRFLTPHRTGPPAAAGEFESVRWRRKATARGNSMAGPTLSLIRAGASGEDLVRAAQALRPHVICDAAPALDAVRVRVSSTFELGGRHTGEERPFLLSIEPSLLEGDEASLVRQAVGAVPPVVLVVSAGCNGAEDHSILAEVTAFLAQRLRALIMLETYGPLPPEVLAAGRHYPVPQTSPGECQCTLVEATVLSAWSHSEHFALVK
jgi:hypothetical protein